MLRKFVRKTITFAFIIGLVSPATFSTQSKADEEKIKSSFNRIDDYFSEIPPDKVLEWLIAKEKRKLAMDIINEASDKSGETTEDKEARFYEPKLPKPLSAEQKKIKIQERIAKKYVGKLPARVEDIVFFINNHDECLKNKIDIDNRLLLHGPSGVGKTYLVKILSEELEMPLLSFSASFFADKYIGEASRKIRKAFKLAKEYDKPLFIFIDEIDALAAKRKEDTHVEHRATLMTLLTELQDLKDCKNVFVFVATNDEEALDDAIRDRFAGSRCEILYLDTEERAQLFKKLFAEKGMPIDEKLAKRLAEVTEKGETEYSKSSHYVYNYISLLPGYSSKDNYKPRHIGFSNRDIEYIVSTAVLRKFSDCKQNPQNCNKHISAYLKKAITETGKKGHYSYGSGTYCDGI